jgi:polyhydroxyalkanoate synthase
MKLLADLPIATTPRDTVRRVAGLRLLRFGGARAGTGPAILLVPSLINRWYVLDLRPGASLVEALLGAGFDVYALDWGVGGDEDRHLTWDDLATRLARAVRWTCGDSGQARISILGYSMGATLAAITTSLDPSRISAFVNLIGPIDFERIGGSRAMVDERWFDLEAIASAGNIAPAQVRAGFIALHPTVWWRKAFDFAERAHDPVAREAFACVETWVNDNVPFPAAAYVRYVQALYRNNELVRGTHHVLGRRVDLRRITCPTLVITAAQDEICPPAAAQALREHVGTDDVTLLPLDGGHVGAVVGHTARDELYPALTDWLKAKL